MKKERINLGISILIITVGFVSWCYCITTNGVDKTKNTEKLKGVCYGPFRNNENPDMGVFPTTAEIEADMRLIPHIAMTIRTYGCTNTLSKIPGFCEKFGIDCYPGAWLGKYDIENMKEIENILQIANQNSKHVKGVIIGNEVLLRKDITEEELINHIREIKRSTTVPVTTAETWTVWLSHTKLADEVDFLMVHIHPYWEGIPIEEAAEYVVKAWLKMKDAFPTKKIIIGETGWPSEGKAIEKAVPSKANQAKFLQTFACLAENNNIEYFFFELFDEKWKDKFEGKAGAYWGIYRSNGSLKDHLKDLFLDDAVRGIDRPPRKVEKVRAIAPLIIYSDIGLNENSFQPSGWMGDTECIDLDKACEINTHSGKTCVRITYSPEGFSHQGWSGIYWQYPLNNWGEYPGYELSCASKLTFWARGEKGSEKAEFKVGGIKSFGKPYQDSLEPLSTGILTLTPEWKKYTIDLTGEDTSNVIGGFCWTTNHSQNPKGCIIYLDDIMFEPSRPNNIN